MALAYSAFPSPHHCSRGACLSNHPGVKSARPRQSEDANYSLAVGRPTVRGSVAGSTSLHILGRASWSLNNFCFFMKQIMSLWIHNNTSKSRVKQIHTNACDMWLHIWQQKWSISCPLSSKFQALFINILVHCTQFAVTNCNLNLFQ